MIAIEQILAARAMLRWTQQQLAAAAGISSRNLHNIEAGLVVPRLETLKALRNTLEKANIEFGDGCTVSLRRDVFDVEKREGEGTIDFLVYDFIESYRHGNKELLLCNIDERRWVANNPAGDDRHYKAMVKYGTMERCLIAHGDHNFLGYPSSYRWIPKKYFSEVSYLVYGPTLALIIWLPMARTVVIRNAAIADSYRRHFEFIWEHAKIPPFASLAQQKPHLDKPRIWLSEQNLSLLNEARAA